MIKIETLEVYGFKTALRGMRNPKDSWDRSDTIEDPDQRAGIIMGEKDEDLALRLASGGPVHAKYRRMIHVSADITAPLYWFKEADTYRFGVEKNSCSTMHTLHKRDLTIWDFSHEHLTERSLKALENTIVVINEYRREYVNKVALGELDAKDCWWQMIQLLPSGFNQKRTVEFSYEALENICKWRRDHKLDEWREFVKWAEGLPYSELFIEKENENENA